MSIDQYLQPLPGQLNLIGHRGDPELIALIERHGFDPMRVGGVLSDRQSITFAVYRLNDRGLCYLENCDGTPYESFRSKRTLERPHRIAHDLHTVKLSGALPSWLAQ